MVHRTHPTQQDEALRQARKDTHVRAILTEMANRFTDRRPAAPLNPRSPEAVTLTITADHHGYGPYSDEIEAAVLQALPDITPGITRGEYALHLRSTAGKVNA